VAWHETSQGIGLAPPPLERAGGSSHDRDGMHRAVLAQIATKREWQTARIYLGPALWRAIDAVVLHGADVTAWASGEDRDPKIALGYLIAALDRLVEYYTSSDDRGRKPLGMVANA
jgi:hypothetical protein